MSEYLPPNNIEPLSVFNPINFVNLTDSITQAFADKNYLKYPNAQGTENLQNINVGGDITIIGSGNFVEYPDGTKQTTAFGDLTPSPAGSYTLTALTVNSKGQITTASNGSIPDLSPNPAGSYTLSNITVNSKGQITSASNGSAPASTPPIKVARIYGSSTAGNFQNCWLNVSGGTSGAWAQNEYFTIRLTYFLQWNFTGSGNSNAQNFAQTTGIYNIYPYRFSVNWCGSSNAVRKMNLSTNSLNGNTSFGVVDTSVSTEGFTRAPYGRQVWGYDISYTNSGGSGNTQLYCDGSQGSVYFALVNPAGWTSSGSLWEYFFEIELLSTGANKSAITTSGFTTNF